MFRNIETHSVLYILHQSTNLSQLPESEVVHLIESRFSPSTNLDLKTQVYFPNVVFRSEIEVEIMHDVALYHGFLCLRSVFETILQRYSTDSYECDNTSAIEELLQKVDMINPLTFRLEILENIFSLLFLTRENLHEHISIAYETDDLETIASQSSQSSRTTSFESLASVDSPNSSPWNPTYNTESNSSLRKLMSESASLVDSKQSRMLAHTETSRIISRTDLDREKISTSVADTEKRRMTEDNARKIDFENANELKNLTVHDANGVNVINNEERIVTKHLVKGKTICLILDLLKASLSKIVHLKSDHTVLHGGM